MVLPHGRRRLFGSAASLGVALASGGLANGILVCSPPSVFANGARLNVTFTCSTESMVWPSKSCSIVITCIRGHPRHHLTEQLSEFSV